MNHLLSQMASRLDGDFHIDKKTRLLYATDASAYREVPLAVAKPKHKEDIRKLIEFANRTNTGLIPRTAGTSLAGQVVGSGIVVDVSRYMNDILEFNKDEKWVKVQPGVILDDLNLFLEKHGLFFGPETSTSNRCMLGGMVGNNACGAHSILYGSTRDHTIAVKGFLSDGTEVEFTNLKKNEFEKKLRLNTLEGVIYRDIEKKLSDPEIQKEIRNEYPDPEIYRRNTGYAIDLLLDSEIFNSGSKKPFNFSNLICGSEGTLFFITEITLNVINLPPKNKAVMAVHFQSRQAAFKANLIALKYNPGAVEMMDDIILELTKDNIDQNRNRFFIKGDPKAILIIEIARESSEEINEVFEKLVNDLKDNNYGYHYPVIFYPEAQRIWNLRKAGLGVLSNMKGDELPVSVVEDTAVNVEVLPEYMEEFHQIMEKHNLQCVYHAHIGSGELHVRPILNLKKPEGIALFKTIGYEIAHLVKKYNGSMSGEHGDGRVRGEFIPIILGENNYNTIKHIKKTWDPNHIFNPGKITDVPPMTENLRYNYGVQTDTIETIFNFSEAGNILQATEKCNGSGDCRKTEAAGGTMCPSYRATKDENDVTRARANILREYLSNPQKNNPFNHKDIYEVMDLCLSCKACKSECPSSVDVAKLKAEFLQHYYDSNGIPIRAWFIANITTFNKLGSFFPGLYNFFLKNSFFSNIFKTFLKIAKPRQLPLLNSTTLNQWMSMYLKNTIQSDLNNGPIYLFNDEFTNYNDADIGIKAIKLLTKLGYNVKIPLHVESGRTFISKGLLRKARRLANKNINLLSNKISKDTPLVGIEPSAILTFRDEYPDLVFENKKEEACLLAENSFMLDEFLMNEMKKGAINPEQFTKKEANILLHGHCQQKAIVSTEPMKQMLEIPENYAVEEIPSGCCGMAGSFGFEKEHYNISMKIGEMTLFPAVRRAESNILICAPGTSCRQQIKEGTGRQALHPVEILYDALLK
ncbi:MAG: FAD-binding and (Fe-S)-binding domain-containing protein [Bacteroidales bacterium]